MRKNFTKKVHGYVKNIPAGEVRSYGEVAKACGSAGGARAVGFIMANNFNKEIPCHRVVRADGSLGQYNRGGPEAKQAKLEKEGIPFSTAGVIQISHG
jgi:O-6-methylguanine DNA methyltransferase